MFGSNKLTAALKDFNTSIRNLERVCDQEIEAERKTADSAIYRNSSNSKNGTSLQKKAATA